MNGDNEAASKIFVRQGQVAAARPHGAYDVVENGGRN